MSHGWHLDISYVRWQFLPIVGLGTAFFIHRPGEQPPSLSGRKASSAGMVARGL
jgi:hypothetical protein